MIEQSIQEKEELIKLTLENNEELIPLGEILGEFHILLLNMNLENIDRSDYDLLTNGVVHNDLNTNNIFQVGQQYFFIDFEFLKKCPLISDLG